MELRLEYIKYQRDIRKQIRKCEGKHIQQVVFSTYHDGFTQICYGCKKIRTTIKELREVE